MTGELLALLTTLCWALGIFPFTIAAQRIGTEAINQYRLLFAWIIISVGIIIGYGISPFALFTTPHFNHYLYLGLSGIIGFTIGDYCSFTSFKILGPRVGSVYTTFAPGAALFIGYIALNETINWVGLVGIAITITGVIWLTTSKTDAKNSEKTGFARSTKGVVYGIVGALCQGTGLVLSKVGMNAYPEQLQTVHAVWIRLLFAFAIAFILSFINKNFKENTLSVFQNKNNVLPYLLVGTLIGPVAGVTLSLMTIQHLQVSVAQTIFALLPIVVLPINYFVYKEKISTISIIACLITVAGVLVLVWRDAIVVVL
jgi:drug/metabolite transporter (DMT)-like permease